jgi:hypothetical protein
LQVRVIRAEFVKQQPLQVEVQLRYTSFIVSNLTIGTLTSAMDLSRPWN